MHPEQLQFEATLQNHRLIGFMGCFLDGLDNDGKIIAGVKHSFEGLAASKNSNTCLMVTYNRGNKKAFVKELDIFIPDTGLAYNTCIRNEDKVPIGKLDEFLGKFTKTKRKPDPILLKHSILASYYVRTSQKLLEIGEEISASVEEAICGDLVIDYTQIVTNPQLLPAYKLLKGKRNDNPYFWSSLEVYDGRGKIPMPKSKPRESVSFTRGLFYDNERLCAGEGERQDVAITGDASNDSRKFLKASRDKFSADLKILIEITKERAAKLAKPVELSQLESEIELA